MQNHCFGRSRNASRKRICLLKTFLFFIKWNEKSFSNSDSEFIAYNFEVSSGNSESRVDIADEFSESLRVVIIVYLCLGILEIPMFIVSHENR